MHKKLFLRIKINVSLKGISGNAVTFKASYSRPPNIRESAATLKVNIMQLSIPLMEIMGEVIFSFCPTLAGSFDPFGAFTSGALPLRGTMVPNIT